MYLWCRFLYIVCRACFRGRLGPADKSVVKLFVFPNDVDVVRVSNGTYLDLGRIDLLIRHGYFFRAIRKGYYPVVSGQALKYKRSLRLFQTFEVHSHFRHCGEKWGYMEHRIYQNGQLCVVGVVKGLFAGPGGKLSWKDAFELGGLETSRMPLDQEIVEDYDRLENSL